MDPCVVLVNIHKYDCFKQDTWVHLLVLPFIKFAMNILKKNQHIISYRHNNCEIIYRLSEHMLVIDIRQTEQIAYYFVLVVTTKYTCVYNIYKLTSEYQIKQCQHHLKVNV